MGVFEKCVMVLELKTLPIKQKNKLKTEIKENGGIISYVVDKKCTHVIVSHMKDVSSHRLKSIQQFQIPVVSVEYVSKCIEEGRLVDEDAYAPAEHQDVIQNTNCKNPEGEEISPLSEAFPGDDQEETVKNKDSLDKFRIYSGREGSLPHFPSVFEVAKYSIFNKVTADSEAGVVVELQCSLGNPALPFCVSRYWGEWNNSKVMQKWKDLIFTPTSEEAVKAYELFIKDLQDNDFQQQTKLSTELNLLASEKVKKLLLEEALSSSSISQEVAVFVELIWTEALGCFDDVLASPVNSISPNDVSRAEGILLQARKAMDEGVDQNGLRGIMSEFYTILQHKHGMDFNITKKMISTKHDLCQLIRDIVNASEATLWSPTPSSLAKYQALRCSVEHVAPNTEEFSTIKELLMHRNESLTSVRIHQIFCIGRVNEMLDFQSQLGNVQPLFHASSASSFVGILSRGLLLPKVAVEQHGIDRTDIGNLGCGIYFSNALSTILKYSKPSESDGTRLLVVCDIALGECKHLHKKDFTLASAPAGYSSVLGVRQTADVASEFQDDEYVVYNPSQVQIKYVVQFCVGEDQVKSFQPTVNVTNEETPAGLSETPAVTDADSDEEYTNPLDSVTEGLQDSSGNKIPLKSVHVKGRMIDLLAQIIVFQTYTNHSVVPIEAKYVFPLDETAAVCGFEAFINGKHVVGEVKEKEKARQEYRQAIQEGHGAYLMDQEAPDVFTISVGNLPPSSTVLIKITYVTELAIEFGSIVFRLPGSVAPWQQSKALNERTQDTVEKICVNEMEETGRGFALDMSVEMPHEITSIWSGTHKIKVKKTQCKAVVITEENSSLGQGGFSLTIDLSEVYLPRMWVEKHPDKDSQACMLVFCPEFAPSSFPEDCEVVIFLDSSNSMRGAVLQEARKIALRLLNSLHCKLNVVIFGTDYKELFPCPQDDVLEAAKQFIMFSPPLMGNTDLWRPLRSLSLLAPSKGVRNIVLISDGHIQSEGLTLRLVKENAHHTRIFTCGVGHTANRHMLRSLAQSGGGAYEFFDMKTKHNWREKIALQVIRMVSPGCSSVSVKWQQFNPNASQPVQAPAQLHSVFSGNQLLVYGFVPHCTQATLSGVVSNQEIQTMVSTTELQKTKGTMLHKLTARAIIRDYEYGNLHTDETEHEVRKAALKSFVIDLSKEYSIVTQYTSFVAIEKRGENETTEGIDAVTTDERIAEEDVDFLPYLTWERAEDDFGESLEEELSLCSSQNVPTTDYMWIEEEEGDAVELQTSLWRDTKHHDAFVQQSFPGLEPVPQVPGGLPVPVITYQAARCLKMHSSPPPPPAPALCYSKTIPEGFTHSAVTGIGRAQNTVSAPVVFSSYSSIGGPALKMTESSYTQPLSGFGQQLSSNSSSEFSKDAFGFGSFSAFGNTSAVSAPANAAFASRSGITLGENNIFSWPASSFAFSSGRTFEQSPSDDSGLVEITHSSVSAPALVRGPAWKVTESSGNSQLFSGFGPGQLPSNSSSEFSKDTFRFGSGSAFGNASAVSAPALVRGTALEVTDSSGYTQPFSGFGSGQQLPSNSSSEFSKGAFGFGSGSAFGNASAVSAPALVRGTALEVTNSSGYTQPFSGFGSGQQLPSNSSSEFSKGAFGFGSGSAFGNASAVSAPALVRGTALEVTDSSGYTQPFSGFGSGQQLPSNSSSEFSKGAFGFGSGSAFGNASAVSAPALVRGTALEVTASSGYTQPFSGFGSGQQLPSNSSSEFSKGAFGFDSGSAFGNASAVSAPALVRGTALEVTDSSGYTQPFSGFGSGQQLPSNSSSEFSKGAFGFGSGSAFGNASAVSAPALVRGTALEVTNGSGYTQPFSGFGSGQQLPSNSSSEFSKGAFGFGSGSAFGNASAVSAPTLVRGTALEVTNSSGCTQPFSGFGSGQQFSSNSSSEFSKGALGNASAVSAPANAAFASGSGFTLGENSIFSQPASSFAFSSGRTFERSPCIDSGLVELDSSSDLCLGMSNKAVPEECSLAKSKSKKSSSLTCFKHLVCNAENTSLANESLLPPKFAPILDTAEVNQLQTKLRKGKMRHKVSAGQQSGTFPIRHLETREDLETPSRSRASLLPWTQLFDLQHQDGYWQFSPELGSLLHMDVDYFANVFLKEKGILSLGVKSSKEILRLVATMLVLQLIRYMEQLEGLIFKSLFQLDDTVHQRSEHWGSVKKAVDWVKVADWRYPSIYWRLELGRDWESTTRQLLCIDPVKQNSPLHLVCITCFKPGCFPKGGLG